MAYSKISLNKDSWTLIANNVTTITFQNASQFPFYVNFTSNETPPSDAVGLIYGPYQGEMRRPLVDMTSVANPSNVWAKTISSVGSVIVDI